MEVGLESAMPTYSGGLGVLAGDTIRAAADRGLPLVAVTLVSITARSSASDMRSWRGWLPAWY